MRFANVVACKKVSVLCLMFAVVVLSSCGGDSGSTTSPDRSTFPQVNGNYSGTLTLVFPERGESATCPASTVVTQSGSNVNVAPIILGGECLGLTIPIGATVIDTSGALQTQPTTVNDPSCGTYSVNGSGGFFGREFRFSVNMISSTCWNINASAVLSR